MWYVCSEQRVVGTKKLTRWFGVRLFPFMVGLWGSSRTPLMLNIKENTLKFHNKNLYHKLGVSSRKELLEIYKLIRNEVELRGEAADVTV